MIPKLIYPTLLGVLIFLIPIANVNASEISELSSNSTDTNATTTEAETETELIPEPDPEGQRVPQSDWVPVIID